MWLPHLLPLCALRPAAALTYLQAEPRCLYHHLHSAPSSFAAVLPYLQSHDAYSVDECLKHCLEHRIQVGGGGGGGRLR